ncbi:MAG: hypothetical protein J6M46_03295 [Lachnospiraceae bacterium]|nr:hypothetical protein [Lachnospiraceae bacterium]
MITETCPHCGAPITGERCGYCGAVFYDFSAVNVLNGRPTYLKLKLPDGRVVIAQAEVVRFDFTQTVEPVSFYADEVLVNCMPSQEVKLSLDFCLLKDEDGTLYKVMMERERR